MRSAIFAVLSLAGPLIAGPALVGPAVAQTPVPAPETARPPIDAPLTTGTRPDDIATTTPRMEPPGLDGDAPSDSTPAALGGREADPEAALSRDRVKPAPDGPYADGKVRKDRIDPGD